MDVCAGTRVGVSLRLSRSLRIGGRFGVCGSLGVCSSFGIRSRLRISGSLSIRSRLSFSSGFRVSLGLGAGVRFGTLGGGFAGRFRRSEGGSGFGGANPVGFSSSGGGIGLGGFACPRGFGGFRGFSFFRRNLSGPLGLGRFGGLSGSGGLGGFRCFRFFRGLIHCGLFSRCGFFRGLGRAPLCLGLFLYRITLTRCLSVIRNRRHDLGGGRRGWRRFRFGGTVGHGNSEADRNQDGDENQNANHE